MRLDSRWSRGTLITLGMAVAAAGLVSPAAADHGGRYKGQGGRGGVRVVRHVPISYGRSYAYDPRGSCGTPAIAGFIGGLIIGNVLAHAAPPPQAYCPHVAADYYYDPYCHERFSSLDAYGDHLDYCRHPSWVRVMDGNSGRCVGERYWQDGRWCDAGDGRGDEDRGDYNNGDHDPGREWNR
jgi:hypothetical protein